MVTYAATVATATDEMDAVFRALADPDASPAARRAVRPRRADRRRAVRAGAGDDALRGDEAPRRARGRPGWSPRAAQGRSKLHFLNPVPIGLVADRWISKYAAAVHPRDGRAAHRPRADRRPERQDASAQHQYEIYIRATPEQVWDGDHRPGVHPAVLPRHRLRPAAGAGRALLAPRSTDGTPGRRRHRRGPRPAASAGAHLAHAVRRGAGRRAGQPGRVASSSRPARA